MAPKWRRAPRCTGGDVQCTSDARTRHPYRDLAEGRETHKCAPVAPQELVDGFWVVEAARITLCLLMMHRWVESPLYFWKL